MDMSVIVCTGRGKGTGLGWRRRLGLGEERVSRGEQLDCSGGEEGLRGCANVNGRGVTSCEAI
jgi:hypothetical protein